MQKDNRALAREMRLAAVQQLRGAGLYVSDEVIDTVSKTLK